MILCGAYYSKGLLRPLEGLKYLKLPSMVAQMVKNLPAMQETWVLSLHQEDALMEEMATHSSFLPGESHGQRSLAGYIHGVTNSQTQLSN